MTYMTGSTLLPDVAAAALAKCARLSRARAISVKLAPHRTPGKPDPAWCSSCLMWSCVDICSIYSIYIYSIYSIYSVYSIYSIYLYNVRGHLSFCQSFHCQP